jgi:hypothetical protein
MSRRSIADIPDRETPSEPLDILTRRPSKAKRDRNWEKQKRETVGVASYRGIPTELNSEIKEIAQRLRVRIGDVARAFLEYGLEAYSQDELKLEPEVGEDGKLTLFPPEGEI